VDSRPRGVARRVCACGASVLVEEQPVKEFYPDGRVLETTALRYICLDHGTLRAAAVLNLRSVMEEECDP
jgi:hypothetical protein